MFAASRFYERFVQYVRRPAPEERKSTSLFTTPVHTFPFALHPKESSGML
jgi:hypothetical protein